MGTEALWDPRAGRLRGAEPGMPRTRPGLPKASRPARRRQRSFEAERCVETNAVTCRHLRGRRWPVTSAAESLRLNDSGQALGRLCHGARAARGCCCPGERPLLKCSWGQGTVLLRLEGRLCLRASCSRSLAHLLAPACSGPWGLLGGGCSRGAPGPLPTAPTRWPHLTGDPAAELAPPAPTRALPPCICVTVST